MSETKGKTFLHPIENSTFIVAEAEGHAVTYTFAGGKLFVPDDEAHAKVLKELNAVADRPGSMITTEKVAELTPQKEAAELVKDAAAIAVQKLAAAGNKP